MAQPAKVERASTWSDVVEEGKRIILSMVIWSTGTKQYLILSLQISAGWVQE